MRRKLLLFSLIAALLLSACQPVAATEPARFPDPTPEITENTATAMPSPSEAASTVPPKSDEVPFTETENFPYPFVGGLTMRDNTLFLTAEQAQYDYDTMWVLLEENYPYFDVIREELGIDWQTVRDDYQEELRKCFTPDGYIFQNDFIRVINYALYEFNMVGHLYVLTPDLRQTILNAFENSERTVYQNIYKIISSPKVELFYQNYAKLFGQNTKTSTGTAPSEVPEAFSIIDEKSIYPNITPGYVDNVPYIKIPAFRGWTDDTYASVAAFFSEIQDRENLIIDIQDNGGGTSDAWLYGLASLLERETYTYSVLHGAKSGTLNQWINPDLGKGAYEDDSWQEDFPYIQPESVAGIDILRKAPYRSEPDQTQGPFKGKIWVLINKWCYSAADEFAVFCKETGFATLVGEATGGNGIGAQPYVIALPYSGLLIYYEPYIGFNRDGTCNGITGTQPDLVPEGGQTALQACLAAIREN